MNQNLGAQLFRLCEADQGRAFISDGIENLPDERIYELARQTIAANERLNKKLKAWLTRRGQSLTALLLLLFLPALAHGQVRGDIGIDISGSQNLGYRNSELGVAGHVVVHRSRFGFEGNATYLFKAEKIGVSGGKGFDASALGRLYVWPKFFAAAGIRAAHQSTSTYSKSTVGPQAGIGYDDGQNTAQVLVDWQNDENNSLGVTFTGERVQPTGERAYLSFRPFLTAARFTAAHSFGMPRETGVRAGIVVAVGWRR